jgi:hypothetical protein
VTRQGAVLRYKLSYMGQGTIDWSASELRLEGPSGKALGKIKSMVRETPALYHGAVKRPKATGVKASEQRYQSSFARKEKIQRAALTVKDSPLAVNFTLRIGEKVWVVRELTKAGQAGLTVAMFGVITGGAAWLLSMQGRK